MAVNLPAKKIYKLNVYSSLLFVLAGIITSLVTAPNFGMMLLTAIIVIIYWLLAVVITSLYKTSETMKQIHLKTIASFVIIMIVFAVQQLMFINIPFSATFVFFLLSLVFLIIMHSAYFRSKFIH